MIRIFVIIFLIILLVFGNFLILNLFNAILLHGFEELMDMRSEREEEFLNEKIENEIEKQAVDFMIDNSQFEFFKRSEKKEDSIDNSKFIENILTVKPKKQISLNINESFSSSFSSSSNNTSKYINNSKKQLTYSSSDKKNDFAYYSKKILGKH